MPDVTFPSGTIYISHIHSKHSFTMLLNSHEIDVTGFTRQLTCDIHNMFLRFTEDLERLRDVSPLIK